MKNKRVFILLLFVGIFSLPMRAVGQNHCFVLAYGDSSTIRYNPILLEVVDLDRKAVSIFDTLDGKGYLPEKKPIRFSYGDREGLLSFLEYGINGKNSTIDTGKVYYYMYSFDTTLHNIRSDSFINVQLDLRYLPGRSSFGLGIKQNNTNNYLIPFAEYGVENDGRFRRLGPYNSSLRPGQLWNLGEMKYPLPVDATNIPSVYYCSKDHKVWLVIVNNQLNLVIDSLRLQTEAMASVIFAYHPIRGNIYCFYLNYEYHSEKPERYKGYGRDWVTPEVLIYNPATFQLIERHSIADFSPGNYPNFESGLADVIGNYIVYYFFEEDHDYNFSPAMLFIFDTRTNEARWLRVGWR